MKTIDNVQVVAGATTNLNAVKLHVATGQRAGGRGQRLRRRIARNHRLAGDDNV